jgi:hypothetical protein
MQLDGMDALVLGRRRSDTVCISVHKWHRVRLLSISARAHEPRGRPRPVKRDPSACCVHAVRQIAAS